MTKRRSFTQELERENWVILHVAKGSTFPVIIPNLCNEAVARGLASKFRRDGTIVLAVCSAGDLADSLKDFN